MDFLYGDKAAHTAMQAFLEEDKDRMAKNDFEGILTLSDYLTEVS